MTHAPVHPDHKSGRTLIGVGVGPGDPELVTLKTVRILREADAILVPYTEATTDGPGRAETIITAVVPEIAERIKRIPFSMRERSGVGEQRKASWQVSADAAIAAFDEGARTVALATVGDPTVFSTFTYLRANVEQRLPDVTVELSPGITAMQALSAASGRPLVEGKEILALVPATVGMEKLGQVLDLVDSVAVYKGGRKLPEVVEQLRKRDRQAVIGTDVTLESEQIMTLDEVTDAQTLPYFSTVLTTPERTTTGGKL
ncbi:precorrin-2 C(20)-methyltransferase [Cutibacterium equinum]|uniref:Precorrin-2 C(20)-methyltransferase n=1 Tax=Cutibacterium equinum TaxID=3016342 RepID=A0ABY7QZ54_9ACTN|nr:precorrin-2 C(20)-methyltransferase [Cutibacterium equinum]WCC80316.1 precorrin-2 C(20)-methyltransferase [Cutibacterium equinum]